ncbi:MAG: phosphoenolpyruvate synthase [Acidimicrobiia bacterium]|nr:phosphoenolpyruvate synthase [Acidimicrobiia bacterium]
MADIAWFADIGAGDVATVGGKNASLGEMYSNLTSEGIAVPNGFATTASAYRAFIDENDLAEALTGLVAEIDADSTVLIENARRMRDLIMHGTFSSSFEQEVLAAYHELSGHGEPVPVAVRSSATAEDLPNASFAGQQESYLMVIGDSELLSSIQKAFSSLFTARAISYRTDMGFDHMAVALSVGVQHMVRADSGVSGVMFTLDPDTGFRDVIVIDSIWGLGENIVQGRSTPDEFHVHKPAMRNGFDSITRTIIGEKELTMRYSEEGHRIVNEPTRAELRRTKTLNSSEVMLLARWGDAIERHYTKRNRFETPMDIEWAKDGVTGELFVVQARPETIHSRATTARIRQFSITERGSVLSSGIAIGAGVASGIARVVDNPADLEQVTAGDVLVTSTTDPDWEPIMKRAAAIVTEHGGRTAHAAIVARELGIPAVVGAVAARRTIAGGRVVTVSCAEGAVGYVYEGSVPFEVEDIDLDALPSTETKVMINLADPDQAYTLAALPVDGVGLARMEFILANAVRVHPMALLNYDSLTREVRRHIDELTHAFQSREQFFVHTLSEGVATIAAAFFPRPVILRFSDFKTNEYRNLIGGADFEPHEENPMIGWRGASRYIDPAYQPAFEMEAEAVLRVRNVLGLKNLHVMVPFCRSPQEGRAVIDVLDKNGLRRGDDGLQILVMAEIPSNILNAAAFAEIFDGFSIGSNDLTQLTLGVDRDSERVATAFNEMDPAVLVACQMLLEAAHDAGVPVGVCGQAPSDYPEFAEFLVEHDVSSISLSPDALLKTVVRIAALEAS